MNQPDVGAERRMYGMMQHLFTRSAHGQPPEIPPARGIVTLQDALDSVLQVGLVIDEATQAGRIPAERGAHAGAMLMLIREYIQPLPRGLADDGVTDDATADLAELAAALRQVREARGFQG